MIYTTLEQDMHMKPDALIASYEEQWKKFEKERWWPWYEQWGTGFFGPVQSRTAPSVSAVSTRRAKVSVGKV